MSWKKTVDCTVEPVSIMDMIAHLKVNEDDLTTDERTNLEIYIKTARVYCEKYRGEAFVNQTFVAAYRYWTDEIILPVWPLSSVTSIKYYDTDGTEYTFSSTYYHVDTYSRPGKVVLRSGYSWPSVFLQTSNPILITFVSGYGSEASDVDPNLREAIMLLAGHLWNHREESIEEIMVRKNFFAVDELLDIDRIGVIS
jgi:uncharacterized phiE125 gp8 family phage protein